MHYSITQTDDGWVLTRDGEQVGGTHATYQQALAAIQAALAADDEAATDTDEGLLPEVWADVDGIAFSEALPGGRDFTNCAWSWRDPAVGLLPVMLQTSTQFAHMGAELAGFITEMSLEGGTVHATGRFYDSDRGREARDLLLGGRRFGVSVDPSEAVDATWECVEEDDDGWCIEEAITFSAYEIAGLTMTPFPGFERAAIGLEAAADTAADDDEADTTTASGATVTALLASDDGPVDVPTRPDRAWFELPEPQLGEAFLDGLGDDYLVDQGDGTVACPLTIGDDGLVFGHVARWGQCHVGYPGMCVAPPLSAQAYAHFHVGAVTCADGSTIAVGAATIGCEHAPPELGVGQTRDHYAHSGSGWADLRVVDGEHGPWACGALRPGLTQGQLRVLRALTFSGDWRRIGGSLELVAALSVNVPGFPIARDAVAASGLALVASARPAGAFEHGEPRALVASGLVARCADCARRQAADLAGHRRPAASVADPEVVRLLRTLELRTRHLIPVEAAAMRAAIQQAQAS